MLSPYLFSHVPISFSTVTCLGSISPLGIGPTSSNRLPSPVAHCTRIPMQSADDFSVSFGFHDHCVPMVMHVSHGIVVLKMPTSCSGVAKSAFGLIWVLAS